MKGKIIVAIGALLALAIVGAGCSSGGPTFSGGSLELVGNIGGQQQGIWVSGQGEVTAVPDIAMLSLGIEAQAAGVAEAQAQASDAMDKVMAALEEQGIDDKDIQTQYFSIQKVSRWDSDKEQEIVTGYRVTNTVSVKVREVDNTGTVIDAVTAAGGDLTRVNSIGFTIDDPSEYYAEAREKAVADAAAKAQQLAETTGVELGDPTYISESSYVPGTVYRDTGIAYAEDAVSSATSISTGELTITANVQIAYRID